MVKCWKKNYVSVLYLNLIKDLSMVSYNNIINEDVLTFYLRTQCPGALILDNVIKYLNIEHSFLVLLIYEHL